MDFLRELNDSQRAAVVNTEGPTLIVAGAGSGKTRVLTYRIAYLLAQGVPAGAILALTFTNKAAREMKERIQKLVGNDARYLWMGTFHSMCGRMLRQEAEKLGYTKDFTIYDTADSKSLIKTICKEHELDDKVYKPGVVLNRISMLKNSFVSPENYGANLNLQREDNIARLYKMYDIYRLYQLRLKSNNAMDFDDMLLETLRLMNDFPEVKNRLQQQFRYILVDEYQDTNHVQYLLIKKLAEPQNNICVVGDDSQSIYSFRGADIHNILHFQEQYSNAKLFKLERNYRSTRNIVNASNSLISNNADRIPKEIYSEKEEGAHLILTAYETDKEEAKGVVEQITKNHSKRRYNDIAILYRTNVQSRLFEDELRKHNIPYRVYGNVSFYQRKEIKDIISYLRLAVNPRDNEALTRAISIYSGIGNTTMKRVASLATEHNATYLEVMQDPAIFGISGDSTIKKLQIFAQKIATLGTNCNNLAASELVLQALEVADISLDIKDIFDREEIDKKQNLQSFVQQIKDFEAERQPENDTQIVPINEFLYEVSLLTDQDDKQNQSIDSVTLMTIHSAKGLEFPEIYITGLEDGVFPSSHCIYDSKETEEERRLFYVAITRAMERCYLCYAKRRFVNGEFRIQKRSMFLTDIDKQYIKSAYTLPNETNKLHWTFSPAKTTFLGSSNVPPTPQPVMRPVEKATSPIANAAWKSGDRVQHRVFGEGTVVRVYRDEVTENDKIEIAFDNVGTKTLLLTHAKLDRV